MKNDKLSMAVANQISKKYDALLFEAYQEGHIEFERCVKDLISGLYVTLEDDENAEATKYIHDSLNKDLILQILDADSENSAISAQGDKVNGWAVGE